MKKFVEAEIEIVEFNIFSDVIVTSCSGTDTGAKECPTFETECDEG